jgi:hypothetical protein
MHDTAARHIPKVALYRGEQVLVLGYEGDDRFTVERGNTTTTIHRRHLDFLRAPIRVVAAVDDLLEGLVR